MLFTGASPSRISESLISPLQTIQALCTIIGNPSGRPTLIVAPKSLVSQWAQQAFQFLRIKALIVTCKDLGKLTEEDIMQHRIVITGYSSFQKKGGENPLLNCDFQRIILDEAHAIKDPSTIAHKTLRQLKATVRWCLTGTPVTRSRKDFLHTMRFIGAPADMSVETMRTRYMLRRTLAEVAENCERHRLPPCSIAVHSVPFMSPEEQAMYDDLREEGRMLLRASEAVGTAEGLQHLIELITRLRQMTTHPQMVFDGRGDDEVWNQAVTKVEALVNLVAQHPPGSKTIVFTHWKREASVISEALSSRLGLSIVKFDGSMHTVARSAAIASFLQPGGAEVMVAQIEAGGVGLNLQAATHVYINSPDWSAAKELQAIARAHRTGVDHKVHVTRIIVQNTVDEYVFKVQDRKLGYAAEILGDQKICGLLKHHNTAITIRDMKNILE